MARCTAAPAGLLGFPHLVGTLLVLTLAACATQKLPAPTAAPPATSAEKPAPSKTLPPARPEQIPRLGGGYYQDDGPILEVPYDLDALPEPAPRLEPLHRFANRPYSILGQLFNPKTVIEPFRQRGVASWYGRKFHGKRTASGEPYDMFQLTAAHPELPIPSYVRVTNLNNGKSVLVRINDRGPFHKGRIIDLSYAAAYRLGYQNLGSAPVEVEVVLPGDDKPAESPDMVLAREVEDSAGRTPVPVVAPDSTRDDPLAVFVFERQLLAPSAQTPPLAATPIEGSSNQYWVQLGAFGTRTSAETFRSKTVDVLNPIGVTLSLVESDRVWRVRAGPYPSRDAARIAVERITRQADLRPVVVQ